jgi:iron complex transport system ATP-binding protein
MSSKGLTKIQAGLLIAVIVVAAALSYLAVKFYISPGKTPEALKTVNATHLANRTLEELSGGELQRVVIARALAVEPEVMLLDEPTSNLDLKYQQETLNLIKALRSKGLTIIMAIHDLTQAYRISDKILMLNNGKVFAAGKPEEVLTPQNILTVYGVPTIILKEHKIIIPAEII